MTTWTLVIDTASGINVGLSADGVCVDARTDPDSRRHVERLQPMIDGLLAAHDLRPGDLSRIGVGVGPGPFTGLRIGIATARTLGLVAGVPVRGFVTLDAVALGIRAEAAPTEEFVVVIDARRKELYWATYTPDGHRTSGPTVGAPARVPELPVGGPGVRVYPDVFAQRTVLGDPTTGHLDAALVAAHLDELPDEGLEPQYLRSPDAEVPKTRKSALAAGRLKLPAGAITPARGATR